MKKRQLLTNKKFSIKMKTYFVKCYVWNVLLYYGYETWTITEKDKKLEAMGMWI